MFIFPYKVVENYYLPPPIFVNFIKQFFDVGQEKGSKTNESFLIRWSILLPS